MNTHGVLSLAGKSGDIPMYISHERISVLLKKQGVGGTVLCVRVMHSDCNVHIRVQLLDEPGIRTIDAHIPVERFNEILEVDDTV